MEEDFTKLLELYLDDRQIEEKISNDLKDELHESSKIATDSMFTVEDTISIGRFVNDYLNISGDCEKLYHSGLRELESDYVMGVDNNFANKNPELVKQGYLLLVIDAKGNRGTYINPFYLEKVLNKEEIEEEFELISKIRINDFNELYEYYMKYMELFDQVRNNEKFYNLLKKAHKVKHLNKILEKRRED